MVNQEMKDQNAREISGGEKPMYEHSFEYDEAVTKFATGRYQLFIYALLVVVTWSTAFNNNGYIFIGGYQAHKCKIPYQRTNYSSNGTLIYEADVCFVSAAIFYENGTNSSLFNQTCSSWDYDQSEFKLTMMSEWNLNSCVGDWQQAVATSIYMIGFLTGCFVLGYFSDRYGRNKLLVISAVGMVLFEIGAAFSVNFGMLVIMRFVVGVFTAGARNAAYVYVCEMLPAQWRETGCVMCGVVYSIGAVLVTAMSLYLPNWRHFQLACGLAMIWFIPYWWLLPESPRWLLSQKRHDEVNQYFKRSARINAVYFPKSFSVHLSAEAGNEGSILSLVRTPQLRLKTMVVTTLWFCTSIVNFGMEFNVGNLSGNIFTNNFIIQATGVLDFVGMWYLLLGRRFATSSAFIISGATSMVLVALPDDANIYGKTALIIFGKATVGTTFQMIYIATSEIYPTTARVTALGVGSAVARIGGAISPYLALSHKLWNRLPYMLFGSIAVLAGLVAFLLPETLNQPLPDSIEEAETQLPLNTSCPPRDCFPWIEGRNTQEEQDETEIDE